MDELRCKSVVGLCHAKCMRVLKFSEVYSFLFCFQAKQHGYEGLKELVGLVNCYLQTEY